MVRWRHPPQRGAAAVREWQPRAAQSRLVRVAAESGRNRGSCLGRRSSRPPPPMASSTNAMRKRRSVQHRATQHSGAPHSTAVRMACGDCCYPACYVKERAGQAIAKDFDISMSSECVLVECSSARCDQAGRLHKVCGGGPTTCGGGPTLPLPLPLSPET